MQCELCRAEEAYNFHHLIPKAMHRKNWFKRVFTKEQMAEGLEVCKGCHKCIHKSVPSEKMLGKDYNTRDKLLTHPLILKYVNWKNRRWPNVTLG